MEKKRSVQFEDKAGKLWTVEATLTDRNGYPELTFTGEGDGSFGQCVDSIDPRTGLQESLVLMWNTHHLSEVETKTWDLVVNIISLIQNEEAEFNAGSEVWEDIEDPKICALGQFLTMTPKQASRLIEESENCKYDVGGTIYIVATDDEADSLCEEVVEQLLDDVGTEAFNLTPRELLDMDGVSGLTDYVVSSDGRGHVLSSYDGCEHEVKYADDVYFIYKE